jgi:hypothetical protein
MVDGPAAGSELSWEDRLPLAWRPIPAGSGPEVAHLYDAALTRLHAILSVGEALAADPTEDATPRTQEWLRLEARLNLLLAMVGELLAAQRPAPAPRAVRLGGAWIAWEDPQPPAPGDALAVDLYLNPALPDAVTLPVVVNSVSGAGTAPGTVQATFPDLPPSVRNALEKLIFRWHRRRVAEQRRTSPPKF